MIRKIFSYDNVYLRPNYSELNSRIKADTSINFLGKTFNLPVIPANMQDVISIQNAVNLTNSGYLSIMHRFERGLHKYVNYLHSEQAKCGGISIGVNTESKHDLEYAVSMIALEIVCIDVAHGYHKKVKDMITHIKNNYKHIKIIAGNVATSDGYKFLYNEGVDAIKVGIGGGSICSTKYKTGFHLPTAYSIYECANLGLETPIIADGGAKHYGDIAKALTLGATMVMNGGWFASCIDSPAKIVHGKKIYRGSTSYESKGHNNHVEGITLELDEGITYMERLTEIKQALCSSISYAGGENLNAFKYNNVDYDIK